MEGQLSEAIAEAIGNAPERRFQESVDFAFTLKEVDLKNPANRIQEEVRLPKGRGKDVTIAMFATGEMAAKSKEAGIEVIDPAQIEELGQDKMKARKLAKRVTFFLSEVPHMGLIGRFLGVVLGPRGKMPRPVPPTLNPAVIAQGLRQTVVVRSRERVTFHVAIGTTSLTQPELLENGMEVLKRVTGKLDRGTGNIRSLYVKTTMGPAIKVELEG